MVQENSDKRAFLPEDESLKFGGCDPVREKERHQQLLDMMEDRKELEVREKNKAQLNNHGFVKRIRNLAGSILGK